MTYSDLRAQIDPEPPRELPCNVAVEQSLLAALLVDNRAFAKVDFLRPEHFGYAVHARIFDAIAKTIAAGKPANELTLAHFFKNDPAVWKAYRGGDQYVFRVAESVVTVANAADHALIIADLALRRALIADLEEPKPAQTTLDVLADFRPRIEAFAKIVNRLAGNGR